MKIRTRIRRLWKPLKAGQIVRYTAYAGEVIVGKLIEPCGYGWEVRRLTGERAPLVREDQTEIEQLTDGEILILMLEK